MRADKLTTAFQQALGEAQSLAVARDNPYIEPAHVLAAMLVQPDGPKALLDRAGANTAALTTAMEAEVTALHHVPVQQRNQADGQADRWPEQHKGHGKTPKAVAQHALPPVALGQQGDEEAGHDEEHREHGREGQCLPPGGEGLGRFGGCGHKPSPVMPDLIRHPCGRAIMDCGSSPQ